jgi:hypothetical protein
MVCGAKGLAILRCLLAHDFIERSLLQGPDSKTMPDESAVSAGRRAGSVAPWLVMFLPQATAAEWSIL